MLFLTKLLSSQAGKRQKVPDLQVLISMRQGDLTRKQPEAENNKF